MQRELYPSKEARDGALASGMEKGMRETMDLLAELVRRSQHERAVRRARVALRPYLAVRLLATGIVRKVTMDAPRTEEQGARQPTQGTELGEELRWLFRQLPGAARTDRELR